MVSIHQQKTGRFVEIPCNAKLRAILEKYPNGMPIYDIMKVTGHKSVTTLEKYIRADKLEVAQKLARKNYQYFK